MISRVAQTATASALILFSVEPVSALYIGRLAPTEWAKLVSKDIETHTMSRGLLKNFPKFCQGQHGTREISTFAGRLPEKFSIVTAGNCEALQHVRVFESSVSLVDIGQIETKILVHSSISKIAAGFGNSGWNLKCNKKWCKSSKREGKTVALWQKTNGEVQIKLSPAPRR